MALSRFRLSNHSLLIETGRYSRPKIERDDRKCFICKDEIEDELHFVTKCPLYSEERKHLKIEGYKVLPKNKPKEGGRGILVAVREEIENIIKYQVGAFCCFS